MPRVGPAMLPLAVVVATGPAARGDNPTSPGAAGRLYYPLHLLVLSITIVAATLLVSACGTSVEGTSSLAGLLPDGERPNWYWNRMESSGYEVTAVSYQQNDYVEYKVVKGDEFYEVQLELDPSGTATKVNIVEAGSPVDNDTFDGIDALDAAGATTDGDASTGNDGENDDGASLDNEARADRETPDLKPATVEVPAGTRIVTKLANYLDSGENQRGDVFSMRVAESIVVDDSVAIPVGTRINGYVESVESAQRPNKGGRLVLKPASIEVSGEAFEVEGVVTAEVGEEGRSSLKEDLKEIAGGAGVGGLVGGLLGGGKGVLAGVLIGGGGMFVATKGEQIELPPDTELVVELRAPVSLPR